MTEHRRSRIAPPPDPFAGLGELAEALTAAARIAESAEVPASLKREVISVLRQRLRVARGLPSRVPSAAPAEV